MNTEQQNEQNTTVVEETKVEHEFRMNVVKPKLERFKRDPFPEPKDNVK